MLKDWKTQYLNIISSQIDLKLQINLNQNVNRLAVVIVKFKFYKDEKNWEYKK